MNSHKEVERWARNCLKTSWRVEVVIVALFDLYKDTIQEMESQCEMI